jgi:hypothetical protein
MDLESIKPTVSEVLAELEIDEDRTTVETAMSAPNSEAVQIRIFDREGGDSKAVVVDLRGKDGDVSSLDEVRQRLREQLATFKEITGS